MIIEQSSIPVPVEPKRQNYLWPLILGTAITLTAVTLPILFVVVKNDRPTGSLLSPLPEGVITEIQSPRELPIDQALLLAQNYLNKAYDLLRNPNPSEADKAVIKLGLNNSLRQAEVSIKLSPENQDGQKLKAQILAEIKKLLPENSTNLSDVQPIIASPQENASPAAATVNSPSNANQNSFILPAGKTEMTIKDTQVKNGSYIYLLPVENSGSIVSLTSKGAGSFTVSVDTPSATDLPISYYVIND